MGELVSTRMAGPPALMELENRFAKTLASVDSFKASADALELFSDGDIVATFHVSD